MASGNKVVKMPIKCVTITVATDGSGNAAVQSAENINGDIIKIVYDKGTVNATTTAVLTNYTALTGPVKETIDSYNVNTASAYRYPGPNNIIVVNDYLLVTVSGGAVSKVFTVYVYYR